MIILDSTLPFLERKVREMTTRQVRMNLSHRSIAAVLRSSGFPGLHWIESITTEAGEQNNAEGWFDSDGAVVLEIAGEYVVALFPFIWESNRWYALFHSKEITRTTAERLVKWYNAFHGQEMRNWSVEELEAMQVSYVPRC